MEDVEFIVHDLAMHATNKDGPTLSRLLFSLLYHQVREVLLTRFSRHAVVAERNEVSWSGGLTQLTRASGKKEAKTERRKRRIQNVRRAD